MEVVIKQQSRANGTAEDVLRLFDYSLLDTHLLFKKKRKTINA